MERLTNLEAVLQMNLQKKYNCAETILRTFNEVLDLKLGDNVCIAAGFGGGIGQTGCICGGLSAAIMVINLITGRKTSQESKMPNYALVAEFQRLFMEQYGATCCRVIKVKRQASNCNELIEQTAFMLAEFISEKGLV